MNWIEFLLLIMLGTCIIANIVVMVKTIADYRRKTTYYTTAKANLEIIKDELDKLFGHYRNGGVYVKIDGNSAESDGNSVKSRTTEDAEKFSNH